jgi:sec-independent protein translocase protein TatA
MFGNLGWTEVLLILLVFLLLFGARRLPEIGQSLGRSIKEFRKSLSGGEEETKAAPPASGGDVPPPQGGVRK